ncbi:uncharacterized protein LOC129939795 [Eupeodes corollae]|uniref:uncharacterized protein LOC129939795 n=1 Tax=Eupeodes corollae TaxID=290404 RepID=UPI002492A9DB|nr:uncharacterized protein LOC129939795 [Eupeodes corollae]
MSPEGINALAEFQISTENLLKMLNSHEIDEIFNKRQLLSEKIKFRYNLNKWLEQNDCELVACCANDRTLSMVSSWISIFVFVSDSRYFHFFNLLHTIILPPRINRKFKPSITDAQKDMFIHLVSLNNFKQIEDEIKNTAISQSLKIQPKIFVVGESTDNLLEFYVCVEEIRYKVPTLLCAIDLCWICVKKCMESVPNPQTNGYNGSGGGSDGINFTLPYAQHNPLVSFLYFNALQCEQTEFIEPITTYW